MWNLKVHAGLRTRLMVSCRRFLSISFAMWAIGPPEEPEEDVNFSTNLKLARIGEGVEEDAQVVALRGYLATVDMPEAQFETLRKGLCGLAGGEPVVDGVPMAFCSDAVGILGIALGARAMRETGVTSAVVHWLAKFLKASYEAAEDWQRCLYAVADQQLGSPFNLPIPKSAEVADVRTALVAKRLMDVGDETQAREDEVQTLKLALEELPSGLNCERAALRLGAVRWASRNFRSRQVLVARRVGKEPLAYLPSVRELIEKHPSARFSVNLVAHVEQAQAEAEVAFGTSELEGRWREWRGVYPWEGEREPETTDCPWWVAGAEYVYSLAAAWRKHFVTAPENAELRLTEQLWLFADFVYWKKVRFHDVIQVKVPSAANFLGGNAERFINVAILSVRRKFAESDRDEERRRAAAIADAIADLNRGSANQSAGQSAPGAPEPHAAAEKNGADAGTSGTREAQQPGQDRARNKPVRRNQKYKVIDQALQKIAESRPSTQQEILRLLDGRHIVIPPAEPFVTARGWMPGFKRDAPAARAWLSKRWAELELPALPRGPKKSLQ